METFNILEFFQLIDVNYVYGYSTKFYLFIEIVYSLNTMGYPSKYFIVKHLSSSD